MGLPGIEPVTKALVTSVNVRFQYAKQRESTWEYVKGVDGVNTNAHKPALRLWSGNQHEVWVAVTRCLRVQWKRIRRVELSRFLNPHPTRLTCFTSLL